MNPPEAPLAPPPRGRRQRPGRAGSAASAGLLLCLWLAACGGGGGSDAPADPVPPPTGCSVAEQQAWLGAYMDEWYFWTRLSPRPAAAAYATVDAYFQALLYTGSDPAFPRDRWSGSQSTESFNLFFGDGAALGYGVSVSGVEALASPGTPLWVRHVEALSPAAAQGVQRGDEVLALNGRSAAAIVAANDFSALTAAQAGQTLTLQLRRAGVERTVVVSAAVFNLTPVLGVAVRTTAGGRTLGLLQVKDMIAQALAPLEVAFAQFKAAGVQELVLDLRYNGGGLVSTGATLASHIAGSRGSGLAYATLRYNDQRAATNNQSYAFSTPAAALGLPRVFVLTGARTCSASEQVINGLRGAGIDVVTVGDTTCGKPVGFLPTSQCGRTYSVVNFESVNARGEGRYFDGISASCSVAEDFTAPQADNADPLLAAASAYADSGTCPRAAPLRAPQGRRTGVADGGERPGMVVR